MPNTCVNYEKKCGGCPLLALPYLGYVSAKDPIYQNTRRFVWSEDNPYFFKGKAGEGIGGPHIGYDYRDEPDKISDKIL